MNLRIEYGVTSYLLYSLCEQDTNRIYLINRNYVFLPQCSKVGAMHVGNTKYFREILDAVGVIEARTLLQNGFIALPFHIHSFPKGKY